MRVSHQGGKDMEMQELDRQALNALQPVCPECGARLSPVIVDGAPVGFDCLDCEKFYLYDNIACS